MNDGVKKAMLEIEIPDELHQRALDGIAKVPKRSVIMSKKLGVIAAALAIVLCATVGAAAVGGHFVDIKNIFGAVTGQQYVNATEDITVKVLKSDSNGILVQPMVNKPNEAPYSEIDKLSIGNFTVRDENGKIVTAGDGDSVTEQVQEDGSIAFYIKVIDTDGNVIESQSGVYTISFEYFVGEAKAEQDLEIFGDWNTEFTFVNDGDGYFYALDGRGVSFTVAGEDFATPMPDDGFSFHINKIDLKDIEPIPNSDAE